MTRDEPSKQVIFGTGFEGVAIRAYVNEREEGTLELVSCVQDWVGLEQNVSLCTRD